MRRTWMILDCNYLCHRAKHSTGNLFYNETPTGVIYGFLKTVFALSESLDANGLVFCWDSRSSKREEIFPDYKSQRRNNKRERTPKEIKWDKAFEAQTHKLRKKYLPAMGYKNVFQQKGYESDDIIASVCKSLPEGDEAIIVTADQDLYQLLSRRVRIYEPQKDKIISKQAFITRYHITPRQWANVKAIAGCSTDGVPGVRGVGITTAIKYLLDQLNPNSKASNAILKAIDNGIVERNRTLVKLPMQGTKKFRPQRHKFDVAGWKKVARELGFKSIKR